MMQKSFKPWTLLPLVAYLLCGLFTPTISAQEDDKPKPLVLPSEGTTDEKLIERAVQEYQATEKEIARLEKQEFEAAKLDGEIVFHLVSAQLPVYQSGNNSERFCALRLRIFNFTDKPLELNRDSFTLVSDGNPIKYTDLKQQLRNYTAFTHQEDSLSYQKIQTPEKISVPMQAVAGVWVFFSQIEPGNFLPDMKLQIAMPNAPPRTLDVNQYARAELKMTVQRIGPKGCLGLVTIEGNTAGLNAMQIVEELESLVEQRVSRAVVSWEPSAEQLENSLGDRILRSVVQMGQQNRWSNNPFPDFPEALRELHLALPKELNPSNTHYYTSYTPRRIHPTKIAAIANAMRTAFETIPREALLRELKSGHRFSKLTALAYGGAQLNDDDLPIVLEFSRSDDRQFQRAAIVCLGEFGHRDAIARLVDIAKGEDEKLAKDALISLASSRYPESNQVITELLSESDAKFRQTIIAVLADYPHPLWSNVLMKNALEGPIDLRAAALTALSSIGHPDLIQVLEASLRSEETKLRDTAFKLLVNRTDAESENLALAHIKERLAETPPDSSMLSLIQRTRDASLTPLLEQHLSKEKIDRQNTIRALGHIGNRQTAQQLAKLYDSLEKNQEKRAVIEALAVLDNRLFFEYARKALTEKDYSLVQTTCSELQKDASSEAIDILVEAFRNTKDDNSKLSRLSSTLGTLGTPKTKAMLREVSIKSENQQKRNYAANALTNIYQNSPANNALYQARASMQKKEWKKAEKQLDIGLQIDPEYPDIYAERAKLYYAQQKLEEAIKDYNQAIEKNPFKHEFFVGRGQALVQQRNFAQAEVDYTKAIKLRDNDARIYSSRAHARAMQEKHAEAAKDYRKSLQLDPNDTQAMMGVALSLAVEGKIDESIKQMEAAQKKQPKDSLVAYNSACVYGRAIESVQQGDTPDQKRIEQLTNSGFDELKRAVELGFRDADWIRKDPDLKVFRDDERFQQALELTKAKSAPAKTEEEQDGEEKENENNEDEAEEQQADAPQAVGLIDGEEVEIQFFPGGEIELIGFEEVEEEVVELIAAP